MTIRAFLTIESSTMIPSGKRSSLKQRLLAVATLASTVLLTVCSATAEIILDDFADSATAVVQSFFNPVAETLNVGELGASRELRFATGGADPMGSFDVNVTQQGIMTTQIQKLTRRITNIPLTAVQFNYHFNPTDVTEGGQNDAILFDFVELVGEIQPTFLRAWVFDNTNLSESFTIELFPLIQNRTPHTLVAPFDEFTIRGGAPGLPDTKTLKEIRFDFFFLGHEGELNWSARLERIRFGSSVVVPEPEAISLFCGGLVVCCCFMSKGGWRHVRQESGCVRAGACAAGFSDCRSPAAVHASRLKR